MIVDGSLPVFLLSKTPSGDLLWNVNIHFGQRVYDSLPTVDYGLKGNSLFGREGPGVDQVGGRQARNEGRQRLSIFMLKVVGQIEMISLNFGLMYLDMRLYFVRNSKPVRHVSTGLSIAV